MKRANEYSLGEDVTAIGVAFYVAPYVNAIVRTGTTEEKQLLFESMLEPNRNKMVPSTKRGHKGEEERLVEQACRVCNNVKNRQTKARDTSLENIERIIEERGLLNNKILAIKLDEDNAVDKNLSGLIAN